MNNKNKPHAGQSDWRAPEQLFAGLCRSLQPGRNLSASVVGSVLTCILLTGLTSCGFLKPAKSTARHFVLSPISDAKPVSGDPGAIALGIGQVHVPAYLFNTSLVIRRGANEVEYLPTAIWAERLDKGLQRVIAANLAGFMNVERVQLSAWQKEEVAAEVYVAIEQFDVDTNGRGLLTAQWSIVSPGGDKVLKSGGSRLSRPGPTPDSGTPGVVATLSELAGELSRELAQALKVSVPVRQAAR